MKKLVLLCALMMALPSFANPKIDFDNGVYHIILDGKKSAKKIDFVSVDDLQTNATVHKWQKSLLTINAGYFDPNNGKTISYISSQFSGFEDPIFNEALVRNPILNKNLDKILNRTEFRVLECGEDESHRYEIVPHNAPVPSVCMVLTSAQGGPEIYPRLRLEEEFFIVKDAEGNVVRESCSVLHKTPRTIIALKDNNVHIFIITNDNPMTLPEVSDYVAKFGVERAMAFDGGSSTSLDYKNKIHVVSTQKDGLDTGRKLKSFMIFK